MGHFAESEQFSIPSGQKLSGSFARTRFAAQRQMARIGPTPETIINFNYLIEKLSLKRVTCPHLE